MLYSNSHSSGTHKYFTFKLLQKLGPKIDVDLFPSTRLVSLCLHTWFIFTWTFNQDFRENEDSQRSHLYLIFRWTLFTYFTYTWILKSWITKMGTKNRCLSISVNSLSFSLHMVLFHMNPQPGFLREWRLTMFTFVSYFKMNRFFMDTHIITLSTWIFTVLALVRLQLQVNNVHMLL